jgi:hypothetical protein
MLYTHNFRRVLPIVGCFAALASTAVAFEGRIHAVMIQGNETNALLYTAGTDSLRVEMTVTNSDPSRAGWPNPVDILDRNSGTLTLLFPNNRSFVHLKPATDAATAAAPGLPGMPAPFGAGPMPPGSLPPGIGPQSAPGAPPMPNMPALPPGVGPETQATPGMPPMPAMPVRPQPPGGLPPGVGPQSPVGPGVPGMPAMPMMPMMPGMMEKMELQATGQKTNLLGFACQQYVLKQRGETLEIWATDQLLPYQPYVQNQPHRFGPQRIEEQWPGMLTSRKLFPLLATLRYNKGAERFRFEVQSVTPQKLTDEEAKLFEPPAGYFEVEPLPF